MASHVPCRASALKANFPDTKASFLDLQLSITNDIFFYQHLR